MHDDSIYYTNQFKWKSVRDTWRCMVCPVWLKPIGLLFAVLRLAFGNRTATYGFPRPDRLDLVDHADVPVDLAPQFEPLFRVLESGGFTFQFYYAIRGIGALSVTTYAAVFLDSARTSFATIAGESASPRKVLFSQTRCSIQSRLTDGSLLITTRSPKHGSISDVQPAHWQVVVVPSATVESEMLIIHQTRLDDNSCVQPIALDREMLQAVILYELLTVSDFSVEQGWYRELTEDEVDALLFTDLEQKRADEKKLSLVESGEEAKRVAREKRLSFCLLFGIGVLILIAFVLGRRAQQIPVANFVLKTPEQTIAFEITHDVSSISCWAEQHPPGNDIWRIEQRLGSVREIGMTPASIDADLDQQRVHFQIGTKSVDFDLRTLEFVSLETKQN